MENQSLDSTSPIETIVIMPEGLSDNRGRPKKKEKKSHLEEKQFLRDLGYDTEGLFEKATTKTVASSKSFQTRIPKQYRIMVKKKLDAFMEAFLKSNGNATQAAANAFDIKSRASAATVGSLYLRKLKELGRVYEENIGLTYGKFINIAMQKLETEKDPAWFKMLMKIGGYDNPEFGSKTNQNVNVNILQEHRKTQSEFGFSDIAEGEIVEEENG